MIDCVDGGIVTHRRRSRSDRAGGGHVGRGRLCRQAEAAALEARHQARYAIWGLGEVAEIVHGKRSISADTALRLSRYFKLSERFRLNLQGRFDLETEKDRLNGRIKADVKIFETSHA